VKELLGEEIAAIGKVAKINQTDHAQGHICPDVRRWLALGPKGIRDDILSRLGGASPAAAGFYQGLVIALEGAMDFMRRYAALADEMAGRAGSADERSNLWDIAARCS
jgi:hypothetical protein